MTYEVIEGRQSRYSEVNLEHVLKGNAHQHSHFTDVSGKNATFENFDFFKCVFIRAYFHNATFSKCRFVGAHFIDCNFRSANLRDCDFSYSSFNGTRVPTKEILNNLPSYPNVRRELLQILRRNAASVGDYRSEKIFIIREIDAEMEHLRLAWRRVDAYYQKRYSPGFRWLVAGFQLLALKIDGLIWGHGERIWKTPIALAALLIVLSVVLTFIELTSIENASIKDTSHYFYMTVVYNINLFFGLPDKSSIKGVLLIDWLVVATRFVAIGVIVAALYRRLSHR